MKKYAYYIRSQEGSEVIAFVENGTKTIRDHSTDWVTIKSALSYKIRGTITPDPITKDNLDVVLPFSRTTGSEGAGHWLSEYVLSFVIGTGYEDPRNMNLQAAQHFYQKAHGAVREAKKTLKRRNNRGGYINPHEF